MRIVLMLTALFIATATFTTVTSAQEQQDFPGLKIDEQAPDFTLKDQENKDVSLDDLIKDHPIAIVFHRSASW